MKLFVDGKQLPIGNRIGKGGEGEVFAVNDGSLRAVKRYTVANVAERETKIAAMVRANLAVRSPLVAFPTAVARDERGKFCGFVMNLVSDHQPLFELYTPGARKQNFPEARYPFLVRTACNIARAVASVHESGCVIGDINHSGFLISKQATAFVIDADSFQIADGSQRYLCRVGVPEYTPPELQSKNLSTIVRTPNHDAFGLAVALFQILAMGRHPYVGSFAKGEMPLERAISEHRFVYSRERASGMMPPPGAPALADFPAPLAAAFEAAFRPAGSRTSAAQWVSILQEYEKSLRPCSKDKLHHHFGTSANCPWCRMEQTVGIVLFVSSYASFATEAQQQPANGTFDLNRLWATVEALRLPTTATIAPKLSPLRPVASQQAVAARKKLDAGSEQTLSYVGIAIAIAATIALPPVFPLSIIFICWAVYTLWQTPKAEAVIAPFTQAFIAADQRWQQALSGWEQRCGLIAMRSKKDELLQLRDDYLAITSAETARIEDYKRNRRVTQVNAFLDRYRIKDTKISGVGPAKLATLTSYGIETAANVSRERLLNVPGFGPKTSKPLLIWRNDIEKRFIYSTSLNHTDQNEIARIKSQSAVKAQDLRAALITGVAELQRLKHGFDRMTSVPDSMLDRLNATRQQLIADFTHLRVPTPITLQRPQPAATVRPRTVTSTYVYTHATPPRPAVTGTAQPNCPTCGSPMVVRRAGRGTRAGSKFWGCSTYPRCRGTRRI